LQKCEILWQEFESGLSHVEEQFAHIDPSIRSHLQLRETKDTMTKILKDAKQLHPTHKDLLHSSKFILDHLNIASEVSYSTLKSKLELLSNQYNT